MKNVKLNLDRIVDAIIESNDFTESGVENAIKNLSWHKSLTIVDSESEAEEIFKEYLEKYQKLPYQKGHTYPEFKLKD